MKNNIFEFSDKTYKQICITAIDTKFASLYAVLFMAALEENILNKVKIFIWKHGEESLKEFINEINSFHPTIKFTANWSKEKKNFLDVEVNLDKSVLSTDLFVKPTETHQFLDHTFCYSYHCKKDIRYSQTLRPNRICSDNNSFDKRCNELESWLLKKGYSEKMVTKQVL